MSAKTADQLAADVRDALDAYEYLDAVPEHDEQGRSVARTALAELVSRLQQAEATIDKWVELGQELDAQIIDLTRDRDGWKQNSEAAEAQVAALTGELAEWRTSIASERLVWRAEEAEARLQTAEAQVAQLTQERDERLSVESADEWLAHRFHQVCDERDLLRHRMQEADDTAVFHAEKRQAAEAQVAALTHEHPVWPEDMKTSHRSHTEPCEAWEKCRTRELAALQREKAEHARADSAESRVSLAEGEIKTLSERLDTLTTALEDIAEGRWNHPSGAAFWDGKHRTEAEYARRALADTSP